MFILCIIYAPSVHNVCSPVHNVFSVDNVCPSIHNVCSMYNIGPFVHMSNLYIVYDFSVYNVCQF